jgi:DNA-binding GntR family transcriptional regulator
MSANVPRRGSSLPVALISTLRDRMTDGTYPAGSRLPSEPDLAAELGVSRPTLREALRELARDGWLVRRHGSGTYVALRVPVPNSIENNFGVGELIRTAGRTPGTSHLAYRIVVPSAEVRARLAVDEDTQVEELTRVRTADGVPVVHSVDYVPHGLLPPGALANPSASLYELLAAAEHPVTQGLAHLRPVVASAALAEALDVARGAALLRVEQVDTGVDGRPVVFSVEHHRAEAFDVVVRRHGPATS